MASSFEPVTDLDQEFLEHNDNFNRNQTNSISYHNPQQQQQQQQQEDLPEMLPYPYAPPPAASPPPPPESANNSRSSSPLQPAPSVSYNYHDYSTFDSFQQVYGHQTQAELSQQQQQQQKPPFLSPPVTIINYYETSPASRQGKRTISIPMDPSASTIQQNQQHPSSSQSSSQSQSSSSWFFRGDATLRPNIGESNAAIGQASLRESLHMTRLANLIACPLTILCQASKLAGHVIFIFFKFPPNPAKLVLSMYLAFLALVVLLYESKCLSTLSSTRRATGTDDGGGATAATAATAAATRGQRWREWAKDQFGLLYHPLGRAFLLFLMGGMAIAQGTIVDGLLGIVFCGNAGFTVWTFAWYPEYRRRVAAQEEEEYAQELFLAQSTRTMLWANPGTEVQALLFSASSRMTTPK